MKMLEEKKLHIIDYKKIEGDISDEEKFKKLIEIAYKKLKLSIYYDKFPLIYREKIAQFEGNGNIEDKLEKISNSLYQLLNNFEDINNPVLENLLDQITYTPFPKKVTSPLDTDEDNGSIQLISNDRKYLFYQLESFELFFNTKDHEQNDSSEAFVTLQIIAILWIMHIGVIIDDTLDPSCYGSRIREDFKQNPKNSFYIYHRYFEKYTEWRDKAFKQAKYLLNKEKRDSIIISLDVTRFYYSVEIDFNLLFGNYLNKIDDNYSYLLDDLKENQDFIHNINKILKLIHKKYQKIICDKELLPLIIESKSVNDIYPCLPIGLLSSGVLANWFLDKFDKELIKQFNPDYYGRYVDDMLLVIKASEDIKNTVNQKSDKKSKIYTILKNHFSRLSYDLDNSNKNNTEVKSDINLPIFYFSEETENHIYLNTFGKTDIQNNKIKIKAEKIRIYYFNQDSSQVILNKLSKQLQQDASFFRFLPDNDYNITLDEVAYDIVTKGSIQKIRNIVDVTENEYELVKYLSNLAIKFHYIDLNSEEINKDIEQIFHFFSGVNIIKHNKLWERIFSILILCKKYPDIFTFFYRAIKEIKKLKSDNIIIDNIHKILENESSFDVFINNIHNNNPICKQCNINIKEIIIAVFDECFYANDSYSSFILKFQKNIDERFSSSTNIIPNLINESVYLYIRKCNEHLLDITNEIIENLLINLELALSIPTGLLTIENDVKNHILIKNFKELNNTTKEEYYQVKKIIDLAKIFRRTNLIRDQYLLYPLFNLIASNDQILTDLNDIYHRSKLESEENLLRNIDIGFKYPSKIYHVWEYLLIIHYLKFYSKSDIYFSLFDEIYPYLCQCELNNQSVKGSHPDDGNNPFENEINTPILCINKKLRSKIKIINPNCNKLSSIDKNSIAIEEYYLPNEEKLDCLKVGIAHLQISDENIDNNLNPLTRADISLDRQKELYELLNKAEEEKCNLVIFPELSIPVYWLPIMISYAKRRQIGLIFGLEHWLKDDNLKYAYNFTVTALPYKENKQYNECLITIRNKNHYPPIEKESIEEYHKNVPRDGRDKKANYHLFHWKGASFTVFNCIELADINHKSLFKSKIDFLVAIEHNKDTKYYGNVVDSISRDLHCYVIQVNVPIYGDSKVIQPKKSEIKDLACISGGKNSVLLTTTLEIKKLRSFQIRNNLCTKNNSDDSYKPLPPGFDIDQALKRGEIDSKHNLKKANIFIGRRIITEND